MGGGSGQRSTPRFHCPPRSLERAVLADHTGTGPFLQPARPESSRLPPSAPSPDSPRQTSNHMPPRPSSFLASRLKSRGVKQQLVIVKNKLHTHTPQHAAATCMFNLGFIFKVNESQELSVIFVPLVLPEHKPMVEVLSRAYVLVC